MEDSPPTRDLPLRRLRSSLPPVQPAIVDHNYGRGGAFGFAFASVSACTATLFSNPLDVAKVRLQMQIGRGPGRYKNTLDCLTQTWKTEGIRGVQAGLSASLIKEGSKNFFRLGAYEPILIQIRRQQGDSQSTKPKVWERMLAGGISGGVSSLLCNPLDLVKTRVQYSALTNSQGANAIPIKPSEIVKKMVREEKGGVRSLWKGTMVNVLRSIVANSVVLTTNFALKDMLESTKVMGLDGKGWASDTVCSLTAALVAITVMNPIDVVRTRLYNQSSVAGALNVDAGFQETAKRMLIDEGPGTFYKGAVSHFLRFGPHTVLTLVFIGVCQRSVREYKEYIENQTWKTQVLQGFCRFDTDKSGKLEAGEVKAALLSILRITPTGPDGDKVLEEATQRIMREASVETQDMKKNGIAIDQENFVKVCYALDKEARNIEIDALFKRVDTQGNGRISRRDIIAAVAQISRRRVPMTEEYHEQLQQYLDKYVDCTNNVPDTYIVLDREQFQHLCVDLPKIIPEAVAIAYFHEMGITL
eukprot:CFRG0995T1